MLFILNIVILLFSFEAFGLSLVRDNDKLILQGESCALLRDEVLALESWTQQTGKSCLKGPVEEKAGSSECKIDMTNCLPDHVVKYHGIKSDLSDPNCYNNALVTAGLLPHLRFSTPSEMRLFFQEPWCRQLDPNKGDTLQPGDIGDNYNHAYTYVSKHFVYSKNNPIRENPVRLMSVSEMSDEYDSCEGRPCTSVEIQDNSADDPKRYIDMNHPAAPRFFRCISLDEFLEKSKNQIREDVRGSLSVMNSIDCNLEHVIYSFDSFNQEALRLVFDNTLIMAKLLENSLKDLDSMTLEEKQVLAIIKRRIISISHSFRFDDKVENVEGFKQLQDALEKSLKEIESLPSLE